MGDYLPELDGDRNDRDREHVELVGPFDITYVVLNGFRVPHLTGYTRPGGIVTLVVDGRFAYDFPVAVYENVVSLVANALAVERGYPHFPSCEDDREMRRAYPFGGVWHSVEAGVAGEALTFDPPPPTLSADDPTPPASQEGESE